MADGLKKLRNSTDKTPKYDCPNCKCKRYNPCRCMKKGGEAVALPRVEGTPETE